MAITVGLVFSNALAIGKAREPYFVSDGGIEGSISISDPQKVGFDLVKVSLEGVLINSVRYTEWPSAAQGEARKLQAILRMSDVKKRTDFVRRERAGQVTRASTFSFHVPQCLGRNLLGEDSEYLSDLPASMHCTSIKDSTIQPQGSGGESRIQYTVRADVIRHEKIVATTMRSVYILPSLSSRPPICVADFGVEYNAWSTNAMRGNTKISRSKVGNCTIQALEPQAVILSQPTDPVEVSIPLKIILQPQSSTELSPTRKGGRDQNLFRQQSDLILGAQFQCKSALVSSTYISIDPLRKVPSQADVEKTTTMTRRTSACARAETMFIPIHEQTHLAESGHVEVKTVVVLKFDDIKNHDRPLVPSFDSAMICHRYRVVLKISLNAGSRMTFNLEMPLAIRYRSDPSLRSIPPPAFEEVPGLLTPTLTLSNSNQHYMHLSDGANALIHMQTGSLDQHFDTSLNMDDILEGWSRWDLPQPRHDMLLPVYDSRVSGIDAPPYVM